MQNKYLVVLSEEEHASILAGLRALQASYREVQKPEVEAHLNDIASDSDRLCPLEEDDIDSLCERLNYPEGDEAQVMEVLSSKYNIGHFISLFGKTAEDCPFVRVAQKDVEDNEYLDIDRTTVVERVDDGAHVLAWHWVENDELEESEKTALGVA